MEKREQVFVSSTYVDLVEERHEVIQTLLEADCIPSGMELFPASDDDRWTLIKRVIDDCDYYLVIVGGRYGSVDESVGLSYTEMEFDYAVSIGTPVMGFLHRDPDSIELGKSELDAEAREKLLAFREKVSERMCKLFESSAELGGAVAKSLIQLRKTHPAEGWVRARSALTPELEQEMADLRTRVAELTSERDRLKVNAAATPPAPDLAQGDDLTTLTAFVDYRPVGAENKFVRKRHAGSVQATWDELFASVCPVLIDEGSERDIDDLFDAFISARWRAKGERPDDMGTALQIVGLREDFHGMMVQFLALGYVTPSERRRAVADTNTYWALTPLGRDHLMRLKAARRPEVKEEIGDTDAAPGGPDVEDAEVSET